MALQLGFGLKKPTKPVAPLKPSNKPTLAGFLGKPSPVSVAPSVAKPSLSAQQQLSVGMSFDKQHAKDYLGATNEAETWAKQQADEIARSKAAKLMRRQAGIGVLTTVKKGTA